MSESHEQQEQPSHFTFQMWDQHLTVLNTAWDLEGGSEEQPQTSFHTTLWNQHLQALNETWHVDATLPLTPPSSPLGKLLFPLKKLLVKWLQPSIEAVMQRQNEQNARVVQTCNAIVEAVNQEAIRKIAQQKGFNSKIVQSLNGLVELIDSELKRLRQEVDLHLKHFQHHFDTMQSNLDTMQSHFDTLQTHINDLQAHLSTLQTHLDARLEQVEPRLEEFQTTIWAFDRRKEALEIDQIALNQKVEQILATLRHEQLAQTPLPEPERQKDYGYLVFEHLYRGDEHVIKQRQQIYVSYFQDCTNVLDIGCGRGEFLELLREHEISGYGVDVNQTMLEYCRKKGLQVEESDILAHLESLEDGTLDGIFIAQMVEHCPPAHLQRLLHLCAQKLQSQHYLIIETQNPQSLYALSHFYRDMSHEKPVHPDALHYLLKTVGFQDINVEYTSPLPDVKLLQELSPPPEAEPATADSITALNANIRQLNDIIYGYLDYAIIARKANLL